MEQDNTPASVDAWLSNRFVTVTITAAGATTSLWDNNTTADAWRVTVTRAGKTTRLTTDYYTGVGLRRKGKPVAPSAADVMTALRNNAAAIEFSFFDWCAELGYDNDSIKALRAYEACCDTGEKLRALFSDAEREQIAEMLADY